MKHLSKYIIAIAALFSLAVAPSRAQEAEADPLADRVFAQVVAENGFVWRGKKYSEVDLQGLVGVLYKGLCAWAWVLPDPITPGVSTTLSLGYYTPFGLGVGVNDYFLTKDHGFLNFKAHETCHTIEAFLEMDVLVANFGWYTTFFGRDGDLDVPGYKRPYSTYCELNVPFKLWNLDWESQVGFIPFNANKTEYYKTDCTKHGFAVTTVSLIANKKFNIKKLPLTAFAGVIELPSTRHTYITAGLKYDFEKLLKKKIKQV